MTQQLQGEILKKPDAFYDQFERKVGADKITTHYCPGCGHGRVHKLIAEAIDKLGIADKTVFVWPVGCSVFGYYYFDVANIQAAHGRAPAVATGISRGNPDCLTISYQGDGDLAAIGTAEIIHAANRGESLTVFFVNNAIYGMTGGQMAPTTLEGQKTMTTPTGRDVSNAGYPIRMAELIAGLKAPVYVERVAVTDFKHINKARKAIQKALQTQKNGQGFSFVEILAMCPTASRLTPAESVKWVETNMFPYYPLQTFKDETADRPARVREDKYLEPQEMFQALGLQPGTSKYAGKEDFIKKFPEQRLRIAGFGGQGVLAAGVTLCNLGMEEGLDVAWLPSYGPEMRGGTANCHATLSGRKIGSPLVSAPNVLIAMNGPSLDEFEDTVEKGGLIFVNTSLIDRKVKRTDVKTVYAPMTEIAAQAGNRVAANMVALGIYLEVSKVIDTNRLYDVIRKYLKKKNLVDLNCDAIKRGIEYIQK